VLSHNFRQEQGAMSERPRQWHHRPPHLFVPNVIYIVTASTLHKEQYFRSPERLRMLNNTLFNVAEQCCWVLEAWALFPNHYHFVARSPAEGQSLKDLLQRLHSVTAREVNRLDGTPGRCVWFQYWDTCLTYEKSYYPRLNYVHNNPVKHGIVTVAEQYPFCSAGWFRAQAEPQFRRKVESFRYYRIAIPDDF
jgi:putative transposase